jgi:hypothetical protein
MIQIEHAFGRFNKETTGCLGAWMVAHLMFKEHNNS